MRKFASMARPHRSTKGPRRNPKYCRKSVHPAMDRLIIQQKAYKSGEFAFINNVMLMYDLVNGHLPFLIGGDNRFW